ncbi:ACT domain-containing protein [Chenggangzhangella methanolivorans]|uniref:ACT domain-containing protein n=1 Tax=Chenggangzhangella methanolivorans TaxID=1437009 RepID=UPI003D184E6A
MVCTPHLGAATSEAQENVALQVAEQMSEYLIRGAVSNAINAPSITAEEAPRLKPFVALAERLGSFAGQLTDAGLKSVRIEYEGEVASMNAKALTSAAITGLLRPLLADVNMVSAPVIARERGVAIEEVRREEAETYESVIRLTVETDSFTRHVAGTVFADGKPRIIDIKGIEIEAAFAPSMLYVTNDDKPGYVGALGQTLGAAGVNIATFNLGRAAQGGEAIALVQIDGDIPAEVVAKVEALEHVTQARALRF